MKKKILLLKSFILICLMTFFFTKGQSQQVQNRIDSLINPMYSLGFDISLGESLMSILDKMNEEKIDFEIIRHKDKSNFTMTGGHSKLPTEIIFNNSNTPSQKITLVFFGNGLHNVHSSLFWQIPKSLDKFLSETNSVSFDPNGTVCECSYSIGDMIVSFDNDKIYESASYLIIAVPQFQSGGAWNIHTLATPINFSESEGHDILTMLRCGIFNTNGKTKSILIECYNKFRFSCG